jgi:hypothetical protein
MINPPDCESVGDLERRVLGFLALAFLGIYGGYLVAKSIVKPDKRRDPPSVSW